MEIGGINNVNKVNKVYKTNNVNKVYGQSGISKGKDSLAISDFAKDLQIANQAVKDTPDIRQDKVDDIKSRMEAGTYNVTASQLADKLLGK